MRSQLFLFFAAMYLLTMGGHFYSIDEEMVWRLTDSLANRGSLQVVPLEASPDFAVARGSDGKWYTSKGLGMPLLALPTIPLGTFLGGVVPDSWLPPSFLAPGSPNSGMIPTLPNKTKYFQHLLFAMLNPLLSALTCALLFDLGLGFGYRPRTALALTLLYGFGSMAWANASHSNFAEPLLSLCTLSAFWAAFRFTQSGRLRWLALSAFAVGYAMLTKVTALGLAPVLLVYLGLAARRRGLSPKETGLAVSVFGAILLAFIGLILVYNQARFGNWTESGYGVEGSGGGLRLSWAQLVPNGLALLFSWGKGLLFYGTPALLFPLALTRFARRFEDEAIAIAGIGAVYGLSAAAWYDWEGGLSWGPRFLLPMVALWTAAGGVLIDGPSPLSRRAKLMLSAMLGWGLLNQLSAAAINWMEWYIDLQGRVMANASLAPTMSSLARSGQDPGGVYDAAANLAYFQLSFSPMVGNWKIVAQGHWDLFWFSLPEPFFWQAQGRWVLLLLGVALAFVAGFSWRALTRRIAAQPAQTVQRATANVLSVGPHR